MAVGSGREKADFTRLGAMHKPAAGTAPTGTAPPALRKSGSPTAVMDLLSQAALSAGFSRTVIERPAQSGGDRAATVAMHFDLDTTTPSTAIRLPSLLEPATIAQVVAVFAVY